VSLYNGDGQIVITQVDGTSYTGLYAADGSYNAVVNNETPLPGLYHPCGALNASSVDDTVTSFYSPTGGVNVILNEASQLVFVVPNGH
jgi:hypothetical protein